MSEWKQICGTIDFPERWMGSHGDIGLEAYLFRRQWHWAVAIYDENGDDLGGVAASREAAMRAAEACAMERGDE